MAMRKKNSRAPDGFTKKTPSRTQCCHCSEAVGGKTKTFPVHTEDGTWCPQCFVSKRARLEPSRWPGMVAQRCAACGTVAASATPRCVQCRSPQTIMLPPKPVILA